MGAEAKGLPSVAAELSRVTASPVPGPAPVSSMHVPCAGLRLLLSRNSRLQVPELWHNGYWRYFGSIALLVPP